MGTNTFVLNGSTTFHVPDAKTDAVVAVLHALCVGAESQPEHSEETVIDVPVDPSPAPQSTE